MNSPSSTTKLAAERMSRPPSRIVDVIELQCAQLVAPAERLVERIELAEHPALIGRIRRLGLGNADDRDVVGLGHLHEPLHRRLARLRVVEHRLDLVALQVALEAGDFRRRGLGVVHHGEREFLVVDLQADQARLIAEHRLGRRDGQAGISLAHFGELGVQGFQRGEELRLALLIIGLVRGVDGDEIRGQRLGGGLDIGRLVPEMRIVAGLAADQRADDDFLAARAPCWPTAASPSRGRNRRR